LRWIVRKFTPKASPDFLVCRVAVKLQHDDPRVTGVLLLQTMQALVDEKQKLDFGHLVQFVYFIYPFIRGNTFQKTGLADVV
jgi:hypothetical protein